MVKKYEDFFRSEADGLEISALCICPEQKPYRAIIQLVHGMCEHKERYIPFMEYLAEQGFVTVIHDHQRTWQKRPYQRGPWLYVWQWCQRNA